MIIQEKEKIMKSTKSQIAMKIIFYVLVIVIVFLCGMSFNDYTAKQMAADQIYYVVDEATGDMYSGSMESSGFENSSFVDAIHINTSATR